MSFNITRNATKHKKLVIGTSTIVPADGDLHVDGNVGIGTSTPISFSDSTCLTISDAAKACLYFEDTGYESSGDGIAELRYDGGAFTYKTASRSGSDFTGSTTRLTISDNGVLTTNGGSGAGYHAIKEDGTLSGYFWFRECVIRR